MDPVSDSVDCRLLQHDLLSMIAPNLCFAGAAGLICAGKCAVEALRQVLVVPCVLLNTARQAASNDNNSWNGIPASAMSAWLEKFPVSDINSYCDELVQIPNFPLALAASLVGYGLRITHHQVLSLLHAKVPGVQVWVQAYEQLNLPPPPGMHPIIFALCCSRDMRQMLPAHQGITETEIQDILHFAIAMPRDGNATASLGVLCELPAAQALDVDVCEGLIQAAIKVGASERVQRLIDRLPTAQQLSQDSIIALLQSAADARLFYTVRLLCNLPAARAATAATVLGLLQAGVLAEGAGIVKVICQLPTAQHLTTGQIVELLHKTVQSRDSKGQKVKVLLELCGAQTIPAATVADLIGGAVAAAAEASPCHLKVAALCNLAGAQHIDSGTLQGLLQAAVELHPQDQQATEALCSLPAARLQDAAAVARLLYKAVAAGGHRQVSALLQIPGSRGIGRQGVLQMLHSAATSSEGDIVAMLLSAYKGQCAAAGQQDVLQLLHAAVTSCPSNITTSLLGACREQCAAAGQQDVLQLLHAAAARSESEITTALLGAYSEQCKGAKQQDVLQLLHVAATNRTSGITTALLGSFSEQYKEAGADVEHIVQAAGHAGMWHNVTKLCRACTETPVTADVIARLLSAVLAAAGGAASAHGDSKEATSVLLRLPATQQLSVQQYTPLLVAAAAGHSPDRPGNTAQFLQWLELSAAQQVSAATVHTALDLLIAGSADYTAVGSLLKLPAAVSISTSDLVATIHAAVGAERWRSALSILQASTAATAALSTEVLLQIVAKALAIYRLWDVNLGSLSQWKLDGIVLGGHVPRLLYFPETATLQRVISQAAGLLASKPDAAALVAPQPCNTLGVAGGDVSIYADTVMAIATAIAAGQLPRAQLSEALLAKLLDAMAHLWKSKQPGSKHGCRMVGNINNNTSYSTQVVYAQITVNLLKFVSKQGFLLRQVLVSSGGAASVRRVGAGLKKAKELVMNQQCWGSGSQERPGTANGAGGGLASSSIGASASQVGLISVEQRKALADVLEQGVKTLLLED